MKILAKMKQDVISLKKKNELISRKHNKVCPTLNYNENIIILALRLLELFYFLLLESKSINQWLRIQKEAWENSFISKS